MKGFHPTHSRFAGQHRGFTAVEILIVAIILGILAAVAIPQFSNASTDSRKSRLCSQLQLLQQQIDLYRLQHKNVNPPLNISGWTVMTEYSDIDGCVSATADTIHIYGPYVPRSPSNPLTNSEKANVVAADFKSNPGWIFSDITGKIYATGTVPNCYFNPADQSESAVPPY